MLESSNNYLFLANLRSRAPFTSSRSSAKSILWNLLITARGFKVALLANDGFSKLLATGLTAVFAIQAFVIIGGVTRVIPLTGVTLPFVSYGGSSIVANFVLLALLLLISDRARREAETEPESRDRDEPLGALA